MDNVQVFIVGAASFIGGFVFASFFWIWVYGGDDYAEGRESKGSKEKAAFEHVSYGLCPVCMTLHVSGECPAASPDQRLVDRSGAES